MATTAADLVVWLQTLDPTTPVLIASDEEGNEFNSLTAYQVHDGVHYPASDRSREEWNIVHPDDLDEYEPRELKRVVVFWP